MEFHRMDYFLTANMLSGKEMMEYDISDEDRKQAYQICKEKCGTDLPAAGATMKKWFGVGEFHKPGRRQLFRLFFSLSLSLEEARRWLVEGALEPDLQINDFNEFFYMYGLDNHLTYAECEEMIEVFLDRCDRKKKINQHHMTGELWKGYAEKSSLNKDDFINYALSIQSMFKGYSFTVLEYFKELREQIVALKVIECEKSMDDVLRETSYFTWLTKKGVKTKHSKKMIRKYVKYCEKNHVLSEGMLNQVEENLSILNRSAKSNAQWLAELFPSRKELSKQKTKRFERSDFRIMDDKYVSEILTVAVQKEKEMELLIKKAPKHIFREQRRRCRLLDRHDLLPLIFFVVQKRHDLNCEKTSESKENLVHDKFVELANQILTACNMPQFHPDIYELDYWIEKCFDGDDVMLYNEMLVAHSEFEENFYEG